MNKYCMISKIIVVTTSFINQPVFFIFGSLVKCLSLSNKRREKIPISPFNWQTLFTQKNSPLKSVVTNTVNQTQNACAFSPFQVRQDQNNVCECVADSQDPIVHFSGLQIVKTEGFQKVMVMCLALGGVCIRFARGSSAPCFSRPCRHLMHRSSHWMWLHQLHPPHPSVSSGSGQTWKSNVKIIKAINPYLH